MSYMKEMQEKDLKYVWHPCSQMKDYESFLPIVIKEGKGAYLKDLEGKEYLDAVSSWWVNLFGHSNQRINEALYRQANSLEHVVFSNFTHEPAIELAEKIISVSPKGMSKVFFGDSGSSAVEIALKMSYQYHQQIGKSKKRKFVALTNAYHGETIGALSVSGVGLYRDTFNSLLLDVIRANGPDCFRCPYKDDRDKCSAPCFENMEKVVAKHHQEITAIIIEPMVQSAAGMKIYSKEYLKKLRALCDAYEINLIADEVAVGFGRTGEMFACNHADISPDIMCVSKGLTDGYLPLSLTLTTEKIYRAFYDDYNTMKAFLHSHSYTGNPLGCSVALESLKIFEEDSIIEKNKITAQIMKKKAEEILETTPHIGEYRQLGMIGAIELVKDKSTKEPFDMKKRVGYEIYKKAVQKGVLLRPLGNIIYFMPPYVVNEKDIEFMIKTARDSIREYFI